MIIKIADFNFDILNRYTYIDKYSLDFKLDNKLDSKSINYQFDVTSKDIEYEAITSGESINSSYGEFIASFRKIAEWIPLHDAFVLHSAVFDVDGEGVAFAARSGTGKTTHMMLWKKLLGDKMTFVNGDKPIVRFFNEEELQNVNEDLSFKKETILNIPYAYGNPWNGKENLGCNMRTPLKHICFIKRSETNFVERLNSKDAINAIFNQVYMPKNPQALMKTMTLIDMLLKNCCIWRINCNMQDEAAQTAYETIFNGGEKNVGWNNCRV